MAFPKEGKIHEAYSCITQALNIVHMQLNLKKKNYKIKQIEFVDQYLVLFTLPWNYTINPQSVQRSQDHELRFWKAVCHPDKSYVIQNNI